MPFTFSHPAIVLPLINKRFNLFSSTGLIVGSMIPDFESFIRLNEHKIYGHTWLGMFWFDLPLALVVAFIFHNVVRDPLIDNLPERLGNKFKAYVNFPWNTYFKKRFLVIILSALIGIALHLLWDAFTHLDLANPDSIDSEIYVGKIRLFKLLQYSNSLLGIIILIIYVLRLPATGKKVASTDEMIFNIVNIEPKSRKLQYWAVVVVTSLVTIFMATQLLAKQVTIVLFIDIVISGILLGFVAAGAVRMFQQRIEAA